ncbi:MAG: hypothetical protein E6K56_11875 [Ignavibacteria bacterium]|nr:MAG: hypothetical protein E6K56_11875 [Ignavibacteria bacterium]
MRVGILGNANKPVIGAVTGELVGYLRRNGISFVVEDELAKLYGEDAHSAPLLKTEMCPRGDLPDRCDFLITLGGDGTMLSAAHVVGSRGVPILGVNLGKLGFLAEVPVEDLYPCLDEIRAGKYLLEERMVLEARNTHDDSCYSSLNEVVVDRGISPRVIQLETLVNDQYLVTYAADGIIVATPTGSTGYSLASGGPIVVPGSGVITVTPISPHTLSARPVLVPDSSVIRISVKSALKPVHLTADGQLEGFYDTPAEFTVRRADYTVKLVKRLNRNYFDLLRAKLLWGRDLRIESSDS